MRCMNYEEGEVYFRVNITILARQAPGAGTAEAGRGEINLTRVLRVQLSR